MKRETRKWLRKFRAWDGEESYAKDALDSDARQRAEIRDLRARLKAVASEWGGGSERARDALDLKNKDWNR